MDISSHYSFVSHAVLPDRQSFAPNGAFYTVRDLKSRGWTRCLIDRFLGHADSQAQNPHFRRGRPMKFFGAERVHGVESLSVFEEETQVSCQRKQAGQRVIEDKTQALVDLANTVEPVLPDWSEQELHAQAYELFGFTDGALAYRRAQVSALMRFCSACEWMLDDYFWHPGIRPARVVIRRKALVKIIQAYPYLNEVALEWADKEKGNAQIDIFLA